MIETPPVIETPPIVETPPVIETPPIVETPPVIETPPPVIETPPIVETQEPLLPQQGERTVRLSQLLRETVAPEELDLEPLLPKSADQADPVSIGFARQIREAISRGDIAGAIAATDALRRYELAVYTQDEAAAARRDIDQTTVERMQELVRIWEERTQQRYAILYTLAYPEHLELLLITRDNEPIRRIVPNAEIGRAHV